MPFRCHRFRNILHDSSMINENSWPERGKCTLQHDIGTVSSAVFHELFAGVRSRFRISSVCFSGLDWSVLLEMHHVTKCSAPVAPCLVVGQKHKSFV